MKRVGYSHPFPWRYGYERLTVAWLLFSGVKFFLIHPEIIANRHCYHSNPQRSLGSR